MKFLLTLELIKNRLDFERNWMSGGNPSFNYNNGGGGGGGGNKSFNNDRGNFGGGRMNNFNNSNNNNNSNGGNFGNDDFMDNNDRMNNSVSPFAVHLRGMPYDCYEEEIRRFFSPLKLVGCTVLFNNTGRHTGEADAYFSNIGDVMEAMKLHKEKMGSRYIELFAKTNDRRDGRY